MDEFMEYIFVLLRLEVCGVSVFDEGMEWLVECIFCDLDDIDFFIFMWSFLLFLNLVFVSIGFGLFRDIIFDFILKEMMDVVFFGNWCMMRIWVVWYLYIISKRVY